MKFVKWIFKFGCIGLLSFLAVMTFLYGYAKLTPKLAIKSANAVMMYNMDNDLFFQGSGAKEWIALEDISPYLIQATITTEDKNFYHHMGFDFPRIMKAMYVNIMSGSTKQGASTISQQYAKNLFLDFDKTWERKIEEMWLTIQMEVHYSKDEILEGYLNTINYGHAMYGIEAASQFYFHKSAHDLTLAESAMLTGIPKSPSYYSPLVNLELAKKRQGMILSHMLKSGVITEEEYQNAINEELVFVGEKDNINLNSVMYYQDAVLRELKTIDAIPDSFIQTGGIRIFTALNMSEQEILSQKIKDNIPENSLLQVSSVVMDPNTGRIQALMGGKDYSKSQYNRAVQSKRQVGSVMKPFLYYAALENGFTSSTTFMSQKTTFTFSNNKTYSPQNYGGTYADKPISLATAIAYSDNIYAVKTHMFLGEDILVEMGHRLGITADLQAVPSLPLGTSEINIMEMAAGYSAFSNEGYQVNPHLILRVEDLSGTVLYQANEEKKQILDHRLTFILSELLTSTYDATFIDYNYPTAINIAPKMSRKYALKSGTTDTDHWSVGYNKDLVTAVWVGYDDNRALEVGDYKYSRNIWVDTMEACLSDVPEDWYSIPDGVVGVLVNPITGMPATTNDKKRKVMYYLKGTEPTGEYQVFDREDDN